MNYLLHYLSLSLLLPFLSLVMISGEQIWNEDPGDTANNWDEEQSFLYHLSEDKKVLTFYDLKWKQLYKVQGLDELPEDISTDGDLWHEKGRLSIREGADKYLNFSIETHDSFGDGTTFHVKGVSRYYGSRIIGFYEKLSKGVKRLQDIELRSTCTCLEVEKLEMYSCDSGGEGATGCGNGFGEEYCEVDCRKGGWVACCEMPDNE